MGPIGCVETSLRNYQSTSRDIFRERRSHLQIGGNLKTLIGYISVSQPPGRVPVPGPGINYTGPREVLLEFVILFL